MRCYKILWLLFFITIFKNEVAADEKKPELILANIYHPNNNIHLTDYLVSEKFDGVRGIWDGKVLKTRGGILINIPFWFLKELPKNIELDGELWLGYHQFSEVSSLIRRQDPKDPRWKNISYLIFEAPNMPGDFNTRIQGLKRTIEPLNSKHIKVIKQRTIQNNDQLQAYLKKILKKGGEGLMLHKKTALYQTGRSDNLLKVKPYQDAEAVVIGYTKGRGKYKNMVGALIVQTVDQKIFKVGSGLTDALRKKPPKIGTTITYKYYGLTKNNLPRHPVFLHIRLPL